ncbi:MAG: hypothetical protein HN790_18385 [Methylococcales bacterium]|jgi:type II secretory pathway component PulM|nr:hypothetical protein [Methylococcales bacterium]
MREIEPREKYFIAIGVAVISLAAIYSYWISPTLKNIANLESTLPSLRTDYQWMLAASNTIKTSVPQDKGKTSRIPSLGELEKQAKKFHLEPYVTRIEHGKKNTITITVEKAPFKQWLQWMDSIEK